MNTDRIKQPLQSGIKKIGYKKLSSMTDVTLISFTIQGFFVVIFAIVIKNRYYPSYITFLITNYIKKSTLLTFYKCL